MSGVSRSIADSIAGPTRSRARATPLGHHEQSLRPIAGPCVEAGGTAGAARPPQPGRCARRPPSCPASRCRSTRRPAPGRAGRSRPRAQRAAARRLAERGPPLAGDEELGRPGVARGREELGQRGDEPLAQLGRWRVDELSAADSETARYCAPPAGPPGDAGPVEDPLHRRVDGGRERQVDDRAVVDHVHVDDGRAPARPSPRRSRPGARPRGISGAACSCGTARTTASAASSRVAVRQPTRNPAAPARWR